MTAWVESLPGPRLSSLATTTDIRIWTGSELLRMAAPQRGLRLNADARGVWSVRSEKSITMVVPLVEAY